MVKAASVEMEVVDDFLDCDAELGEMDEKSEVEMSKLDAQVSTSSGDVMDVKGVGGDSEIPAVMYDSDARREPVVAQKPLVQD